MEKNLSEFFIEKIEEQYGDLKESVISGLKEEKKSSFRLNRVKSSLSEIEDVLNKNEISFSKPDFFEDAFIIEKADEEKIKALEIYNSGKIYFQSLSSMLPVLILDPKEKENILDMCSAPGGKATQIASLTENKAFITACEKNKIRFDRLKYNLEKQGIKNYNLMKEDSRFLSDYFKFDKILLDSPCSGSGTESVFKDGFSKELLEKVVKFQEALLKKAINLLSPGGEIIYSTCSILKDENEKIIEKFFDKLSVVPIEEFKGEKISYLPGLKGTITVCPNSYYEGFFVAKLQKK